jgi:putative glycosyltransferase (TIGR04348 family)
VSTLTEYRDEDCEILVALHAVKSATSIARFTARRPDRPVVLAIAGTDIRPDADATAARRSIELADRVVFLWQPSPANLQLFDETNREKVRVIYQSAEPPAARREPDAGVFEVCVLGHLRPVKDPLRAAEASRLLPASSRVRVLQIGAALSPELDAAARAEQAHNPRYRWPGELPRPDALHLLSGCRLLAMTSLSEGGPNAVSEALACGVPVVSTRIPGVTGLLGDDYPGYYPVGDTAALAELLWRCETDAAFYDQLAAWCNQRRALVVPAREAAAWRELLDELM